MLVIEEIAESRCGQLSQPIVEIKNLNKTIKGKHIIKDLNLDFYPGQITGFWDQMEQVKLQQSA